MAIEWTDINLDNRTVTINHPVKGHNPRILPVSKQWIAMVERLPKESDRVFPHSYKNYYSTFSNQRRRIANKLGNPRISKITFTTLRHFKGTVEYHITKDILHVKQILGHKSINNTMIYINLEAAIFQTRNDDFTVKVAKTLDEACQLVEVGFEYVTDINGAKISRKRK